MRTRIETATAGTATPVPGAGDIWGGLAGAAVILPQSLAFGVALFVPFGLPSPAGALAGLVGAALLCGISGLVGGTRGLIAAPTGPALALLAGSMHAVAAGGLGADLLAPALVAIVVGAGLLQILIAVSGGGRLIKYIPYPVISGFMTGSALLMIQSQLGPLAGHGAADAWHDWRWLPAMAAAITFLAMQFSHRLLPALPGTIAGLAAGTVSFHLVAAAGPGGTPAAWLIGELPAAGAIRMGFSTADLSQLPFAAIVTGAAALAILASLNTLLTAVVADVETGARHATRRTLVGAGCAQICAGLFGGMGGSATTGATVVAIRSGARRWAGAVCGLVLALLVLAGRDIGRILPIGVLAGIILHVAVSLIDRDIVGWARRRGTRLDAGIALLVTAVTVVWDLTVAIAIGVAIAIAQFIHSQVRQPVVHRRSTATQARSLRRRTDGDRRLLDAHGDRIVLYELRGNLFFATADQLLNDLAADLVRPSWVILHLQRVSQVDITAIRILQQMAARLQAHGGTLIFCNVHEGLGLGEQVQDSLRRVSAVAAGLQAPTFNGRDESLEYAEDALLAELGADATLARRAIPLPQNDLCRNMAAAEVELLAGVLQPRLVETGQKIFSRGDTGAELFIVVSGEIDLRLPTTRHHYKRLTTCGAGTFFGELAFVSPGPRAADAVATQRTELLMLDRAGFDSFADRSPRPAMQLLMTLGRIQVEHQRWSTAEIQRLSEW